MQIKGFEKRLNKYFTITAWSLYLACGEIGSLYFLWVVCFDLVSKFLDRQLQITDSLDTALSVTGVWSMYEHVECKLL